MAALAVCYAHVRAFVLVDFPLSDGSAFAMFFYAVTGLHHQAVMVFFVLSGFLVGGGLLREFEKGEVDWSGYILKRLSRLWVVLVPALLLTLLWDKMGAFVGGPGGYAGDYYGILNSGPAPAAPVTHSAQAFFENVLFLQTITGPVYGSNGPLWSLAYEGWYYAMFPLVLLLFTRRTLIFALAGLVACFLFLASFSPAVLLLGCNWLFGVGLFFLFKNPALLKIVTSKVWGIAAAAALVTTLMATRAGLWFGHDLLVGFAFACMVPWLYAANVSSQYVKAIFHFFSNISYTLYLSHFPILAFVYFCFFDGQQLYLGVHSLLVMFGLLSLSVFYATVVWWIFERNTGRIRRAFSALPLFPGTRGKGF